MKKAKKVGGEQRKERFSVSETLDSVVIMFLGTAWLTGTINGVVLGPVNTAVGIGTLVAGVLLLAYDCCILSERWSHVGWILLSLVLVVALLANM